MSKKRHIPNPNLISMDEKKFIESENTISSTITNSISPTTIKKRYTRNLISMPEEFCIEMNQFLKDNPIEGNKSNFIVRVVGEYIKRKKSEEMIYQNKNYPMY